MSKKRVSPSLPSADAQDARRIICSPRCLPKTFAASLPI